jgi:hypothetical protein
MPPKPQMILIAGPYRSGTNDDPTKMAANLKHLESVSWSLFQLGYLPMIGEWVALPIWRVAGGQTVGDDLYEQILHPTATLRCRAAFGRRIQGCGQRRQTGSRTRDSSVLQSR